MTSGGGILLAILSIFVVAGNGDLSAREGVIIGQLSGGSFGEGSFRANQPGRSSLSGLDGQVNSPEKTAGEPYWNRNKDGPGIRGRPYVAGVGTGDGTSLTVDKISGGNYTDNSFSIGHGQDIGQPDGDGGARDHIKSGDTQPIENPTDHHASETPNIADPHVVKANNGQIVIGGISGGTFGKETFSFGLPGRNSTNGVGSRDGETIDSKPLPAGSDQETQDRPNITGVSLGDGTSLTIDKIADGTYTDNSFSIGHGQDIGQPDGDGGARDHIKSGATQPIQIPTDHHASETPNITDPHVVKANNGQVVIGGISGGSFGSDTFSFGLPGRNSTNGVGGRGGETIDLEPLPVGKPSSDQETRPGVGKVDRTRLTTDKTGGGTYTDNRFIGHQQDIEDPDGKRGKHVDINRGTVRHPIENGTDHYSSKTPNITGDNTVDVTPHDTFDNRKPSNMPHSNQSEWKPSNGPKDKLTGENDPHVVKANNGQIAIGTISGGSFGKDTFTVRLPGRNNTNGVGGRGREAVDSTPTPIGKPDSDQETRDRSFVTGVGTGDGMSLTIEKIGGGTYADNSFSIGHGQDIGQPGGNRGTRVDINSGSIQPIEIPTERHVSNRPNINKPDYITQGDNNNAGEMTPHDRVDSQKPINMPRNDPSGQRPSNAPKDESAGKNDPYVVKASNGQVTVGAISGGRFGHDSYSFGVPGRNNTNGYGDRGGEANNSKPHLVGKAGSEQDTRIYPDVIGGGTGDETSLTVDKIASNSNPDTSFSIGHGNSINDKNRGAVEETERSTEQTQQRPSVYQRPNNGQPISNGRNTNRQVPAASHLQGHHSNSQMSYSTHRPNTDQRVSYSTQSPIRQVSYGTRRQNPIQLAHHRGQNQYFGQQGVFDTQGEYPETKLPYYPQERAPQVTSGTQIPDNSFSIGHGNSVNDRNRGVVMESERSTQPTRQRPSVYQRPSNGQTNSNGQNTNRRVPAASQVQNNRGQNPYSARPFTFQGHNSGSQIPYCTLRPNTDRRAPYSTQSPIRQVPDGTQRQNPIQLEHHRLQNQYSGQQGVYDTRGQYPDTKLPYYLQERVRQVPSGNQIPMQQLPNGYNRQQAPHNNQRWKTPRQVSYGAQEQNAARRRPSGTRASNLSKQLSYGIMEQNAPIQVPYYGAPEQNALTQGPYGTPEQNSPIQVSYGTQDRNTARQVPYSSQGQNAGSQVPYGTPEHDTTRQFFKTIQELSAVIPTPVKANQSPYRSKD